MRMVGKLEDPLGLLVAVGLADTPASAQKRLNIVTLTQEGVF